MMNRILAVRTNLVGTVLISILASTVTVVVSQYFSSQNATSNPSTSPITSAQSIVDCYRGVYSPVQNKCVDQNVFDAEMKRLFAALGIDTSIYNLETSSD